MKEYTYSAYFVYIFAVLGWWCLLLFLLSSCNESGNQLFKEAWSEYRKNQQQNDSLARNKILNPPNMEDVLEKTIEHELAQITDSSDLVIRFDECEMKVGRFFNSKRRHALCYCHDKSDSKNERTYFWAYRKDKGNKWVKEVDDVKECTLRNTPLLADFNLDQRTDLAINWRYCGNYCNGSLYTLYLYDKKANRLIANHQLEEFLHIAVDKGNKIIYAADECKKRYAKLRWNRFELTKLEEIEFECDPKNPARCKRHHYTFKNGERKKFKTEKTSGLPVQWAKMLNASKL